MVDATVLKISEVIVVVVRRQLMHGPTITLKAENMSHPARQ